MQTRNGEFCGQIHSLYPVISTYTEFQMMVLIFLNIFIKYKKIAHKEICCHSRSTDAGESQNIFTRFCFSLFMFDYILFLFENQRD